jgi:hypothetical protein
MTPYDDLSDTELIALALREPSDPLTLALAERLEMRRRDITEVERQLHQITVSSTKEPL